MHFDDHVASEVSESGQHIGDKFCVVPGFIGDKKVLHDQNKTFPLFQFIEFSNSVSLMSSRICGPSKIPAFNFSMVNPEKHGTSM